MTITATPIVFLDSESDVVISCVPSVASGKAERSELSDFSDSLDSRIPQAACF